MIGVIAGLFDAGLDVTKADLIIGTSAGSTAAAQITGASPTQLLADILSAAPRQRAGPVGSDGGRVPIGPVADHMRRTGEIIAAAEDAADMRRRLGTAAPEMDAASDGTGQTRWRATVAARLPSQHWPERTMMIAAVDADTGEPVVFDRNSGVDLADAIAASTPTASASLRTVSATADTSTAATDGPARMPTWPPGSGGCWCSPHLAANRAPLDRACSWQHRSTNYGPAAAGRNRPPGQQLPQRLRQQPHGSVDAGPRRSSGLRAGRALAAHLTEFWR